MPENKNYNPFVQPQNAAIGAVCSVVSGAEGADESETDLILDDLRLVWFCYILGGWKAMVAAPARGSNYYEVTYNASNGDTYIDTYQKVSNTVIEETEK